MRWSLSLGRIAGIRIYVHFTFFLLLAFVAFSQGVASGEWGAAVGTLLLFAALAVIIVLHELGHALAANYYGIRTRDITLLPIGGVARLERMPEKPLQELVVALAGPAVNVVLAAGLFGGLLLRGQLISWESVLGLGGSFVVNLIAINIMLALFNMIPAFPMDGGRVLRALLALTMDYVQATRVAAYVGQGLAIVFALLGLGLFRDVIPISNPMLLLIALFVWTGAEAEAEMVRTKSVLAGVPVYRLMATHFHSLRPDDPLAHAADLIAAGFQHDFPVVHDGRVVGMLAKKDLLEALASHRPDALVEEVMQTDFESLHPRDTVETALNRFQSCECQALPVTHRDELVGILTIDRIGEYLMLHERLPREPSAGPAGPHHPRLRVRANDERAEV